ECFIWADDNSINPKPHLATSWEYEYWSEEINSKSFMNRGGIKAINITLREGVKFQDGSNWNATVAKWNIDRLFVISGNLTGNGDLRNSRSFWYNIEYNKPYFTLSWNLSEYDADGISFSPEQYAGYIINDNTTIFNPKPYGGTDPEKGFHLHYAPYDMYPIVRQVKIIEDNKFGGEIRVEFNDWNTKGILTLKYPMISMKTYKDYFDRGIYGYDNNMINPRNPSLVPHMIGTGPYVFVQYDETIPGGYMLKNENYWNKTALEAEGWFDIDRLYIFNFPLSQIGEMVLNTAIITRDIDYIIDGNYYYSFDDDVIIYQPNINYKEIGFDNYFTQITLNCINETWWSWGSPYNYRDNISILYSDHGIPRGIPRALRKAMSYAFDYDLYTDNIMNGRVKRVHGILSPETEYYNFSIPCANYNLTKAREILLTTEDDPFTYTYSPDLYNFSKLCEERNLTQSSTDAEWRQISDKNPIFTINFFYDWVHSDLEVILQNSLKDIGISVNSTEIQEITLYQDILSPYWESTFEKNCSIWSTNAWVMEYPVSAMFPEDSIGKIYRDPNYESWRVNPWAPAIDPSFNWFPSQNFAFCYDEDIDNWLGNIWFSNQSGKNKWFNKIANKIQNEIFPMIYISQGITASVLHDSWRMNLNLGPFFFANFKYIGTHTRC
ncbi:MAG: ABC transporter substrate-binding protein, partial [Candidatus Hermodarchaeota archaeon]